jgi:iron complex outermembrane receptor protein
MRGWLKCPRLVVGSTVIFSRNINLSVVVPKPIRQPARSWVMNIKLRFMKINLRFPAFAGNSQDLRGATEARKQLKVVTPAKAGVQKYFKRLDTDFRRYDVRKCFAGLPAFVVMTYIVAGAISIWTPSAFAGAPPDKAVRKVVLQEVVVTATRDQEEVRKVPANVTVITEEEIRDSGATNLVEILERQEGIQFRSYSGHGPLSIIDLRGMGGDNPYGKVQIQLNGRRLNRPDMASINWFQIPLSQVERIEIVRGSAGVLHGDSAVAGVINIITRKGEGKPSFHLSAVGGSYGLHDEKVGASGSEKRWSYAVSGENYYCPGYRERSTVSSQGAGLDLAYDLSDDIGLSMGVSFNRTDYELPGNLTVEEMAADRRQHQPARPAFWTSASSDDDGGDRQTELRFKIDSMLGDFGRAEIGFSSGIKDAETNYVSWGSFNNYTIRTYALTPKYILEKNLFGHANKLTAGVDYVREPFKMDRYADRGRSAKLSVVDLERETTGYYIRDEFNLAAPLILSAGYRSEEAVIRGNSVTGSTKVDFDTEKTHRGQAHELGLTWLIDDQSKVFAKYATAYRLPFIDEQASYYGWGNGFLTDLEKETAKTVEVGTNLTFLKNLTVGLTLFRIDMENEIAWNSATFRNENLDSTRHQGVEGTLSWLWDKKLKLYGSYTYHKATFENGAFKGKELPLVPNRTVSLGAEVYLPGDLSLRPEARFVSDAWLSGDNDNSGEKLPSYRVFDLFLFYRPEIGRCKISAFAGVENLANELYATYGMEGSAFSAQAYYPMPERTIKCGVSFEF